MERQASTENSGKDYVISRHRGHCLGERCLNLNILIIQRLTDFVGHCMANAYDILAEAQAVTLHITVAQLHEILADDRFLSAEIDNLHIVS